MDEIYLITGITGFLGRTVAKMLLEQGKKVVGLRLPGDKTNLLDGVDYQMGDITAIYTMEPFFRQAEGKKAILIHCAGLVTIASEEEKIWKVNVDGTRNIVDLCEKHRISRLVYVSSVHAIPEKEKGQIICETDQFSASLVKGIYGKSKAEATAYVKKAADKGMDAAHLIIPSATSRTSTKSYPPSTAVGKYPFRNRRIVSAIYPFVSSPGPMIPEGCTIAELGKKGETYILAGEYISVKRMFDILSRVAGKRKTYGSIPLEAVKWIAPFCEKVCHAMQLPLLVTPYSVYTLGSNGEFSHDKAARELGYVHRPIEETLADTVLWLT